MIIEPRLQNAVDPIADAVQYDVAMTQWQAWIDGEPLVRAGRLLIGPVGSDLAAPDGRNDDDVMFLLDEPTPGVRPLGIVLGERALFAELTKIVEPGDSVLTIGVGLAPVAAAVLGATRVMALERSEAVSDAIEAHAEINGVADRIVAVEESLVEEDGTFDVLVLQIVSEESRALCDQLANLVVDRGARVVAWFTRGSLDGALDLLSFDEVLGQSDLGDKEIALSGRWHGESEDDPEA